jgi:membrane-associated phospholipid phosphatase
MGSRRLSSQAFAGRRSSSGDRNAALAAGAAYLGLGWCSRRSFGWAERGLFAEVNHSSERIGLLRVPQQLGTPWILPLLTGWGFVTHRPQLAVTAAFALPLEKGMEVGVKKLLARPRPAQVDQGSVQHDDAPVDGPSYPSGHAAIAFAAVTLAVPYISGTLAAVGFLTATTTAVVRVRQGAHFPGDAVGGALLGIAVASGLRWMFGRPGA